MCFGPSADFRPARRPRSAAGAGGPVACSTMRSRWRAGLLDLTPRSDRRFAAPAAAGPGPPGSHFSAARWPTAIGQRRQQLQRFRGRSPGSRRQQDGAPETASFARAMPGAAPTTRGSLNHRQQHAPQRFGPAALCRCASAESGLAGPNALRQQHQLPQVRRPGPRTAAPGPGGAPTRRRRASTSCRAEQDRGGHSDPGPRAPTARSAANAVGVICKRARRCAEGGPRTTGKSAPAPRPHPASSPASGERCSSSCVCVTSLTPHSHRLCNRLGCCAPPVCSSCGGAGPGAASVRSGTMRHARAAARLASALRHGRNSGRLCGKAAVARACIPSASGHVRPRRIARTMRPACLATKVMTGCRAGLS